MFESQKSLKAIERARQEIEKEKQLLLQEKEELLFIKNQLEDTTPKIDISNVYVFKEYIIIRVSVAPSNRTIEPIGKISFIIHLYNKYIIKRKKQE